MKFYTLIAALLLIAAAPAQAVPETLHTERSLYRNILVTQDDGLRCLTFRRFAGGHRQTCTRLSNPNELVFPYAKMMLGALTLNPNPKHILIIGLGGGTLPTQLRALVPGATIDIAELDEAVFKVAKTYFNFKPDAQLGVTIEDGRVFVRKALKKDTRYDLIMLDAFEDDYIPEHLLTREFLAEVKGLLTEHGVLAANTFSSSGLYPYESATYAAVFGPFYNLLQANRIIWAQNGPLTGLDTIRKNGETLAPEFEKRGLTLDWLLPLATTKQDWPADTRILTDQYSPSNLLNGK